MAKLKTMTAGGKVRLGNIQGTKTKTRIKPSKFNRSFPKVTGFNRNPARVKRGSR